MKVKRAKASGSPDFAELMGVYKQLRAKKAALLRNPPAAAASPPAALPAGVPADFVVPEADVNSVQVTDADMADPELAAEMAALTGGGEYCTAGGEVGAATGVGFGTRGEDAIGARGSGGSVPAGIGTPPPSAPSAAVNGLAAGAARALS